MNCFRDTMPASIIPVMRASPSLPAPNTAILLFSNMQVPFQPKGNHSIVRRRMLIGLTGRNAAGKGEVARYLEKKSFYYYSLSDVIREDIRSRGQEPTRELLIQVGNELRQRYGGAVLAERILAKIEDDKHYVIDSIRNPAEVEAFRAAKHFKLVRVEAPLEVRFQRILSRRRESDPRTLEEF